MWLSYDKDSDTIHIEFKKGEFFKNKKIDDLTIADLDEKSNILGIELLDARECL